MQEIPVSEHWSTGAGLIGFGPSMIVPGNGATWIENSRSDPSGSLPSRMITRSLAPSVATSWASAVGAWLEKALSRWTSTPTWTSTSRPRKAPVAMESLSISRVPNAA